MCAEYRSIAVRNGAGRQRSLRSGRCLQRAQNAAITFLVRETIRSLPILP